MVNVIYMRVHQWTATSARSQATLRGMVKRLAVRTGRETQIRSDRKPHHMFYAFRPRQAR